jgi:hypothetical protein
MQMMRLVLTNGHRFIMKISTKIILLSTLIALLSCSKESNITGPVNAGQLIMTTDYESYSWSRGDIVIDGKLRNVSGHTLYAQVDDYWGSSEHISFAGNSAGRLEVFDDQDKSWQKIDILWRLIEGSKIKQIVPDKEYPFKAHLSDSEEHLIHHQKNYRFRLDYYRTDKIGKGTQAYCDYSNPFEIIP